MERMKIMNKARRIVFMVMVGIALTTATGCAKKGHPTTGFIKDYPEFKEGPYGGADWVYIKEEVDFKKYHKIMMDHVVFYWQDDAKYEGIQPEVLNELSEAFHRAMVETLNPHYPLVDKPGPDVLRLRFALTDVVPSRPALNTITTILPVGLGIGLVQYGVTGKGGGMFVGEASIEMEALDSETNERVGAAIDRKPAPKYKIVKGAQRWEQTKDAFTYWAERIKKFLDEAHGK
jgi:hypothetical protein